MLPAGTPAGKVGKYSSSRIVANGAMQTAKIGLPYALGTLRIRVITRGNINTPALINIALVIRKRGD